LRDAALASSAPHAITFDEAGRVSHVLDPHSGQPAAARWRLITLRAPRAALADALSTACCLMDRGTIETTLARFSGVDLVRAIAV
jgi:thiamine biosynthesis lipoprotein